MSLSYSAVGVLVEMSAKSVFNTTAASKSQPTQPHCKAPSVGVTWSRIQSHASAQTFLYTGSRLSVRVVVLPALGWPKKEQRGINVQRVKYNA